MHAASCIPAVTGAWQYEGGGAFHNNADIYHWNKSMIEGHDARDPNVRMLDQSRIGAILTGDREALRGGPPVTAMLIQNTNPVSVAPDQNKVKAGFARDDLFVCVHEQFMTETAQMADVVLPATMFLEHDDFYQGGGHQYIILGPKLVEPPGECRSNHEVICALAKRVGATHPGFAMSARELIDWTLQKSGWGTLDDLEAQALDRLPAADSRRAHYLDGFNWPDKQIPLQAGLAERAVPQPVSQRPGRRRCRLCRTIGTSIEEADEKYPFRLATSPARGFLNSTFNETPTSLRAGRPSGGDDPSARRRCMPALPTATMSCSAMCAARCGCTRGYSRACCRGVLIAESIWPNEAFADGRGINTLTGADPIAPYGGAAFHDNKVWIRRAD